MADYTIILDDFDLAMRLGIHPHEADPQPIRLSVELCVRYASRPQADAIAEVLDYDVIRDGVLALAAGPGFGLQETLVDTVADLCLSDPRVRQVRVRSMKLGIYPDARVGCEVVRTRD